ncbi:hypothetical protein [Luteolibacter luteus]|uniref:Uncharacterized protein n=1 Tax=Luteolibacter luteus TaxID=2728835 RepID=A0A858RQH8_9BACT|nr:hypothetical protein [Luteolibacter luteus]QJE98881.1 hypothetical protein HHL09_24905 [Luteolibacter luteus]
MAMITFNSLNGAIAEIGKQLTKLAGVVLLPATAFLVFCKDFIIVVLVGTLEPIGAALDALVLNLDVNALNVNLGKVNSIFPIPEFLAMVAAFVALWAAVQGVKWVLKFIPTMG